MTRIIALALALAIGTSATAQLNCSVKTLGPGCGPVLNAFYTPNGSHEKLNLAVTGAWPNSKGLTIWGFDNIAVTWPNSTCTFYTSFVWGHTYVSNANGDYSYARSWPGSIRGFFRIQHAAFRFDEFGNLEFKLTNGELCSCL